MLLRDLLTIAVLAILVAALSMVITPPSREEVAARCRAATSAPLQAIVCQDTVEGNVFARGR